ncbi:Asp-tRNA(Asn)/Glu-tRNA(Gln) amidotransferase subunit GatC [Candidatus Saccharibacteria bacterium]|nr:Asp-tRNA(Asn)/Glu-tRNA(Gln) amidotransferase subunit GatC [Candidatus Saccharibacteria bacterium]
MEVDKDTIRHLADLSDFALSDAEATSLEKDLQNIINYISELDKLDTSGVEPTYQVFEMENIWRDDIVTKQDATREQLLAMTKDEKDNQIKVPKVL